MSADDYARYSDDGGCAQCRRIEREAARKRTEHRAQPVEADDYWSPEPMSQASAEFMSRQSGSREGADR